MLYDKLDVSTEEMENVDLYMQCLGVPARRNTEDPVVKRGEKNFYEAKCHLCHVTTLHTRPSGSTLLNGTRLPWLGGRQSILIPTSFSTTWARKSWALVSTTTMSPDWLWAMNGARPRSGIGLQEKVNGHTYFLHDGRARNFTEAIMWHGGEGEASRQLFAKMPKADRDALIRFLESL